jgi:hypothetical protein
VPEDFAKQGFPPSCSKRLGGWVAGAQRVASKVNPSITVSFFSTAPIPTFWRLSMKSKVPRQLPDGHSD